MADRKIRLWAVACFAVALLALLAFQPSLNAAPKTDGEKPATAEAPANKSTAKRRTANKPVTTSERRPRMPAHFNKVASPEQRDKVLALLKEYEPRIAAKRAELKALVNQRDQAVFGVLTPEQQKQVETYRAESAAKRAATLAARREGKDGAAPKKSKPAERSK